MRRAPPALALEFTMLPTSSPFGKFLKAIVSNEFASHWVGGLSETLLVDLDEDAATRSFIFDMEDNCKPWPEGRIKKIQDELESRVGLVSEVLAKLRLEKPFKTRCVTVLGGKDGDEEWVLLLERNEENGENEPDHASLLVARGPGVRNKVRDMAIKKIEDEALLRLEKSLRYALSNSGLPMTADRLGALRERMLACDDPLWPTLVRVWDAMSRGVSLEATLLRVPDNATQRPRI